MFNLSMHAYSLPTFIFSYINNILCFQPERLDPTKVGCDYTVLSNVWSFGITLVRHKHMVPLIPCTYQATHKYKHTCPVVKWGDALDFIINLAMIMHAVDNNPILESKSVGGRACMSVLPHTHAHTHTHTHAQLEITLGRLPYPVWRNIFEQLTTVLNGPPPTLPSDGSHSETPELQEFTTAWLVVIDLKVHCHA